MPLMENLTDNTLNKTINLNKEGKVKSKKKNSLFQL